MSFSFLIVCHTASQATTKPNVKFLFQVLETSRLYCWANHMCITDTSRCHIAQPADSSNNPTPLHSGQGHLHESVVIAGERGSRAPLPWMLRTPSGRLSVAHHRWKACKGEPTPPNMGQVPSVLLFPLHNSSHVSLSSVPLSESKGSKRIDIFLSAHSPCPVPVPAPRVWGRAAAGGTKVA